MLAGVRRVAAAGVDSPILANDSKESAAAMAPRRTPNRFRPTCRAGCASLLDDR
jgi:hypothetical protein